jgi:outer membrane protein OmpA-like peptidoglycan-associated protein
MRHTATLVLLLATSLASGSTAATEARSRTVEILETVTAAESGGLRVWSNDGSQERVSLGDEVVFHFRSESDGYLTALYLDGHGVATLLFPSSDIEAGRIRAGEDKRFPPENAGWELRAQLPLGRETLFAVLTPEPIPPEALGVEIPSGELLVLDADRAPDLAASLAAWLGSRPSGAVATARADQLVLPRALEADAAPASTRSAPQYTKEEIVSYFTRRHRSITRPKLDLNIHFDFNSARLTPSARRDLDEVGKALADGTLNTRRFVLEGHTDDVGSTEYNEKLSVARANAARDYLVETHGVDASRLATRGLGESQPLVPGTSEEARALNRRVVLEMARPEDR